MTLLFIRSMSTLGLLAGWARTAAAQTIHTIELTTDRENEVYKFTPASIAAKAGDVVVFKVVNGAPHSVVFESKGLSNAAKTALNGALERRSGELTSPTLTKNKTEYKFVLPKLPTGTYKYFCLPHRAYDMRGEIVVE